MGINQIKGERNPAAIMHLSLNLANMTSCIQESALEFTTYVSATLVKRVAKYHQAI